LGYALIGQPEGVDLTALGKQISAGGTAPLFSRATSSPVAAALASVPLGSRSFIVASVE